MSPGRYVDNFLDAASRRPWLGAVALVAASGLLATLVTIPFSGPTPSREPDAKVAGGQATPYPAASAVPVPAADPVSAAPAPTPSMPEQSPPPDPSPPAKQEVQIAPPRGPEKAPEPAVGAGGDAGAGRRLPATEQTAAATAADVPTASIREDAPPREDPAAAPMVARSEVLLKNGDVTGARMLLRKAAELGSADATFRLAETYDPRALAGWRVVGLQPDPVQAKELYAKAAAMGQERAKERLVGLP